MRQYRSVDEQTRRQLPESARVTFERTERIAETLVGQSERSARSAAEAQGITVRIAGRDGRTFYLTVDLRFSRINLMVEDGVVTQARAS
jgi:hypothetical protein